MKKQLLLGIIAAAFSIHASSQCLSISCNGNTTVNNDASSCGAVVNYGAPTVLSNSCSAVASDTFNFTGAMQTYVVPPGVTSVTIQTWGAQGGANWVNNTNFGGYVAACDARPPIRCMCLWTGPPCLLVRSPFKIFAKARQLVSHRVFF